MKFIPASISRTLARQVLVTKKHSPHIMFGAGVVGVVGSTILACRATLKLGPVLDDFKADIDGVKERLDPDRLPLGDYSSGDYRKDMAYVYMRDTTKIVRLYAPALVVGVVSIGALTGSHVALTRRNTALTATVVALSNTLQEYRNRVMAELGAEKERELYVGATTEEVTDEKGKKSKKLVVDPNKLSPYARLFDEYNPNWKPTPEYNLLFLKGVQNYINDMLQSRGHVFLNEVYDALGMDHSKAGAVTGWVISTDGDNYIDFGLYKSGTTPFVNGWEPSILLDFNVDGVILDKIGK